MKIGDIITKEQFLKFAPLGLTALSSSPTDTLIGYCPKAAAKCQEIGEEPFKAVPGYVILDEDSKEARSHIVGYWRYVNQGVFKIHTLPNMMPLLKRRSL